MISSSSIENTVVFYRYKIILFETKLLFFYTIIIKKNNVLKIGLVTKSEKVTGSRFTGRTSGRTGVKPVT